MDKNWSITDYIEGDEQKINDLFNNIFNKTRTLDHWNWEFNKNPKGSKMWVLSWTWGYMISM